MAMGYSLTFGNHALNAIPKTILIPTMLGITFGFIAKDIQDFNGDRSTGVVTLPSILYKDTFIGRLPVAILIGISYLFYIIFIPKVLIGAIIFSTLTFIYTIFIKKPKEWLYFIMLYLFGFYLLLVLLKG
jgi:4-hydroxybenzoate polyprenyltransferase